MSLSKIQRTLLINLLLEKEVKSYSKNTFSALVRRKLLDENKKLTKKGILKSMEFVPLEIQCKEDLKDSTAWVREQRKSQWGHQ